MRTSSVGDSVALTTVACLLWLAGAAAQGARADSPLADAAEQRDWRRMEMLLASRVQVSAPQPDGATALHWAAYWDEDSAVEALIRAGANVNAANDHGVTPLALAAENRASRIVERLLAAGAGANARTTSGETVLMTAARAGDPAVVKALLDRGASVNVAEPVHQQTALMWAAAERHGDVVRLLTGRGADVNARSRIRRRTVMVSVRYGDQKSIRGITDRDLGGYTPLMFAASAGDVESARHLIAAGANVNDTGADGASAIAVAAISGHGALAAFLLERGADPNHADGGYTPLHAAVLRADRDLLQTLLRGGARVDARLTKGTPSRFYSKDYAFNEEMVGATALWLAARFGEPAIMRLLAAAGADPNAALPDGTTPLMAAILPTRGIGGFRLGDRRERYIGPGDMTLKAEGEDEAVTFAAVECAVDIGANVNAVNRAGDTPLHLAAGLGVNKVIRLLAERGANQNIRNMQGKTPLGIALTPPARVIGATYATLNVAERVGTADLLRSLGGTE